MSRLKIFLLGPPQVEVNDAPVEMKRRKVMALLAYLAVIGDAQRRDTLATLLWPDSTQRSARTALRRHLWELNKRLGGDWLQADRENVSLRFGTDFWLDVAQFQARLAACRRHDHPESALCPDCLPLLSEAAALYRADFLSGFSLSDSPDFDEWQYFQAESLRQDLGSVLERLARGYIDQGEPKTAIPHARRWLALDPLHEPAHRQLMQIYAQTGQRAQALRQYHECIQLLEQALGVPPQEETVALYKRIRQNVAELEGEAKKDVAIPLAPPSAPARHNLPVQTTRFVGREAEFERLAGLLADPTVRLVTILGHGGMGKTRLALEAAKAQLDHFEHGVYFVRLAPLDTPESIVPAIAEALSFSFYEGSAPEQQLQGYLREKNVLLLMDSYEHLLEGVEVVIDLLKVAPGLKILATSRASLSVREEQRFPLIGLDFPAETDFEKIGQFGAGQLFVESARRVQPRFELIDEASVARICRLVGGMPLGIILAAAWVELLSVAEIAAELAQSLDFLETDLRDLPERQRSMRAVFDHSWRLLGEQEQMVFQQLSIFQGGFTREAAQAITGASLRTLAALVNKSLLQRDLGSRYEVHELLRQFAAGKLAGSPTDQEAAVERHSSYFLALLRQREVDLKGADQQAALAEISTDMENIHTAWGWAVFHEQCEKLSSAIDSLGLFCEWSGRFRDGERLFAAAIDQLTPPEDQWSTTPGDVLRLVSKLLVWRAVFNHKLGNRSLAEQLLGDSLAILDNLAPASQSMPAEKAFLLLQMEALSAPDTVGLEQAKGLCEQSLALYQAEEDRWGAATALDRLGRALYRLNEHGSAKSRLEQSLGLYRTLGDAWGMSLVLSKLALVSLALGDLDEAERLSLESLEIGRKLGYQQSNMAFCLASAGFAYEHMGKYAAAIPILQEALAIFQDIGFRLEVAYQNRHLSFAKVHLGQYKQARQHAQTSLGLFQKLGQNVLQGSGQYFRVMGMAALASGIYDEAQQHFQKAATALQKVGHKLILGEALIGLVYAARALGERHQARRHLLEALHTALDSQHNRLLINVLPATALLLANLGQSERAVELYSRALQHPHVANSHWFEDVAGRQIAAAAETLPPEVVAAAQERGQKRDLWETAVELLAELEQN